MHSLYAYGFPDRRISFPVRLQNFPVTSFREIRALSYLCLQYFSTGNYPKCSEFLRISLYFPVYQGKLHQRRVRHRLHTPPPLSVSLRISADLSKILRHSGGLAEPLAEPSGGETRRWAPNGRKCWPSLCWRYSTTRRLEQPGSVTGCGDF